jgi:hypothetical protein
LSRDPTPASGPTSFRTNENCNFAAPPKNLVPGRELSCVQAFAIVAA